MSLDARDELRETAQTRHRDYILMDYEPLCDPVGRLHPASAYRHLLRAEDQLELLWPLVEALKEHLGPEQTVWGVKYTPRGVSTELYFYNNRGNPKGHPMAVTTLAKVLAPHVPVDSRLDESLPYFMCSVELNADTLRRGEPVQFCVYLGSGDRDRTPCGFSYRVDGDQFRLENHYAFYYADKPAQLSDARTRLAYSTRAGSLQQRSQLIPDTLTDCRTVCYAVKPNHDGLYFSRIDTAQLRGFLLQHLPGPLCDLLGERSDELAHLRWDLGYDFNLPPAGAGPLVLEKVGIYGVV